jgi:hypothetical protein
MKKILLVIGTVMFSVATMAQNERFDMWRNTQIAVAIQAEQMIEKIGFENLMETFFKQLPTKLGNANITAEDKKNIATARKALAAMYGAGIDFSRKAWIMNYNQPIKHIPDVASWVVDKQNGPHVLFVIPVKNMEVVENALNDFFIMDNNNEIKYDSNASKQTFSVVGETKQIILDNILMVLTKEYLFISSFVKIKAYDINIVPGKIVSTDTFYTDATVTAVDDYLMNKKNDIPLKPSKPLIAVDEFVDGQIVRNYTYGDKKNNKPGYQHITEVEDAKIETAAADPAVTSDTTVAVQVVQDEAAKMTTVDTVATVAASNTDWNPAISKTQPDKIEYEYKTIYYTSGNNTSYSVNYKYVPFKIGSKEYKEQQASLNKRVTELNEQLAQPFFNNYQNLLVFNTITTPDMTKVVESTDDVAIYNKSRIHGVIGMNMSTWYLLSSRENKDEKNQEMTSISFYNFENGKMVAKMQMGCCDEASQRINQIYQPVTNFYPDEMNGNNFGMLRYNLNLPAVVDYFNTMATTSMKEEMEKNLLSNGLTLAKIIEPFTGELVMTIDAHKKKEEWEEKERTMPQIMFALKLKDPKKAVELTNTLASENLESTKNYRYDRNANYLLINTNDLFFTKPTVAVAANRNLSTGHYGEMNFDIKKALASFVGPNDKRDETYKVALAFFSTIAMQNNKTEDGNYTSRFEISLGDANKNSLENLRKFFLDQMEASQKDRERRRKEYETELTPTRGARRVAMKRATTPKTVTKKPSAKKPVAKKSTRK